MAIEKNYLSTYGWEVPDAYYKVADEFHKIADHDCPLDDEGNPKNMWTFSVDIFRNKAARDLGNAPLSSNVMKVEVLKSVSDKWINSQAKTNRNNMKTACYGALKELTHSFRTEGTDV